MKRKVEDIMGCAGAFANPQAVVSLSGLTFTNQNEPTIAFASFIKPLKAIQ